MKGENKKKSEVCVKKGLWPSIDLFFQQSSRTENNFQEKICKSINDNFARNFVEGVGQRIRIVTASTAEKSI